MAQSILARVLPHAGGAHRVGISGVPGAGRARHRGPRHASVRGGPPVAVLAVDPSSTLSGGSILGDKSRMEMLARQEGAFIRPSPSGRDPRGVARRTRETMLLVEAAGFDVVLVETVGVGQSETAARGMVDTFVVLPFPAQATTSRHQEGHPRGRRRAGVNKADGERVSLARAAARDHGAALRYLRPASEHWAPPTLTVSAHTGDGIDELWSTIEEHRRALEEAGALEAQRNGQAERWMWSRWRNG